MSSQAAWQTLVADALADAVDVAAWVPDKRLAPIAARLEERVPLRVLTSEEACVGYAAGVRAAGGMPAVLFQSSGLGNALNALGSLAVPYGLGFPIAVSMRGTLGERNPAQTLLGKTTASLFGALGIQSFSLDRPERAAVVVAGALALAEGAREVAAILLEPELDLR
jgi:sulfopyruvate decarboxylase TPP-binding subunit